MGDRFGVCNASVYRIVKRVISAINRNWTSKVINWPCSESVTHVTNGFLGRRGLQGVIGAIDGSRPRNSPRCLHQQEGFPLSGATSSLRSSHAIHTVLWANQEAHMVPEF